MISSYKNEKKLNYWSLILKNVHSCTYVWSISTQNNSWKMIKLVKVRRHNRFFQMFRGKFNIFKKIARLLK